LTICRSLACVLVVFAVGAVGCDDDSDGAAASDLGMQEMIGMEFVQKRGCPTCHQSSGATDGTLSGNSTPVSMTMAYPGNLTPDVETGLGGWADIEIIRAMRAGVDNEQARLCPTMPRFDGTDPSQPAMTDVEANAIVAYLRALPAVKREIPESTCAGIKPPVGDLAMPAPPGPGDMAMAPHD